MSRRLLIRTFLLLALIAATILWALAWRDPTYEIYGNPAPLPAAHLQHGLLRVLWATSGVEARLPKHRTIPEIGAETGWSGGKTDFRFGDFWLYEWYSREKGTLHEYRGLDIPAWPYTVLLLGVLITHLYICRKKTKPGFPVEHASDK